VGLLFIAVSVRSFVGDAVAGSWRGTWTVSLVITLAAVAGKALGGIVADRFGWRECVVGALLLLVPVVGVASTNAPMAALSMFLIQTTMAVTLMALFTGFPKQPATIFGLSSGVLLIGALPGLTGLTSQYDLVAILTASVALAGLFIFVGLGFVARHSQVVEPEESLPADGPVPGIANLQ
jgi:FSR family fosmidomycin resistance protein-like MFS transporter